MWQKFLNILLILVVWSSVLPVHMASAETLAQPPPVNLLINGGFEEGDYTPDAAPTGWRKEALDAATAVFTWDDTVAHSGSKSVKINLDTLNDARWAQTVALQPNTEYEFSGWIKTQGVPFMHQRIDAGANLSTSGGFQLSSSHGVYGVNDWTYVSFNFNSASWTELSFFARIGYYTGSALGTAWFDDLALVPITRSTDANSLLWNGSFEQGSYFGLFAAPYGWMMDRQGQAILNWVEDEAYFGARSLYIACPDYCSNAYVQLVTVQPNTNYLLSGWIKTQDVGHTTQTVDAGANLTIHGTWLYTLPLFGTNDWTYVSLLFNSGDRTVIPVQARIGYDAGVARGNAWFDGLQLRTLDANMIVNPDFALGANPWLFYTNGQALFTTPPKVGSSDAAAKVEIAQKGTDSYLYQQNLFLEPRTRYRLQFSAYSSSDRDFRVDLQQAMSTTSYGLRNYQPNLAARWKTNTVIFTTKNFTAPVFDAQLRFTFSRWSKPGEIYWIDDVALTKLPPKATVREDAAHVTGSVAGRVVGTDLPVTVQVVDLETGGAMYQAVTTTDNTGQFSFVALPMGAYELQVQPPAGSLTPEAIVFTSDDGLTDLEVLLEATDNTIFLPKVAR